jgi:hypothetical protein
MSVQPTRLHASRGVCASTDQTGAGALPPVHWPTERYRGGNRATEQVCACVQRQRLVHLNLRRRNGDADEFPAAH